MTAVSHITTILRYTTSDINANELPESGKEKKKKRMRNMQLPAYIHLN